VIAGSLAAALMVLPVAGAPRTLYDLHARTEVRYRDPGNIITGDQYEGNAIDLDVDAGIDLAVLWRRARVGLGYRPRLVLSSLFGDTQRSVLHEFYGSGTLKFRKVELTLSERVSFGEASFTGLTQPTTGPSLGMDPEMDPNPPLPDVTVVQAVPYSTEFSYLSTETSLSSAITLSRRVGLTLTLSYSMSGGADAESRRAMPRSEGPHAVASLDYVASRRDTLTTSVEAVSVRTTYGPTLEGIIQEPTDTRLMRAGESWRRRLSRNVSTSLSGGAELVFDVPPDGDAVPYPYGSGSIAATWAGPMHSRFTANADVGVSTTVDRMTGLSDQRWSVGAGIEWRKNPWSLQGNASRSESLSGSDPLSVTLTSLDFGGRYELTKMLRLESGARLFQQDYAVAPVGSVRDQKLRWTAYVAISFDLGAKEF
jgi:hypothetical protein